MRTGKVRSFIIATCIVLLTIGASSSLAVAGAPASLCKGAGSIRAGNSVGPVALGMSVAEAGRALNARPQQSVTTVPTPDRTFFGFWAAHAVQSMPLRVIVMDGRIAAITLEASGMTVPCQFSNGIGITSTRGDILRTLGAPDLPPTGLTAQWLVYDHLGVMFALGTLGNPDPLDSVPVTSIEVFAPDRLCVIYRERCKSYGIDVP